MTLSEVTSEGHPKPSYGIKPSSHMSSYKPLRNTPVFLQWD